MSGPQGYTKKQSRLSRQKMDAGDIVKTATLSAAGSETVELGIVATEVTISTTGNLVANAQFSIDGQNFYGSGTVNNTASTYGNNNPQHLVKIVKITWTSGSGSAVIAAR